MEGRVPIGFRLSPHLYTALVHSIGWFEDDSLLTWENLPVVRDHSYEDGNLKVLTVTSELAEKGFDAWEADTV